MHLAYRLWYFDGPCFSGSKGWTYPGTWWTWAILIVACSSCKICDTAEKKLNAVVPHSQCAFMHTYVYLKLYNLDWLDIGYKYKWYKLYEEVTNMIAIMFCDNNRRSTNLKTLLVVSLRTSFFTASACFDIITLSFPTHTA